MSLLAWASSRSWVVLLLPLAFASLSWTVEFQSVILLAEPAQVWQCGGATAQQPQLQLPLLAAGRRVPVLVVVFPDVRWGRPARPSTRLLHSSLPCLRNAGRPCARPNRRLAGPVEQTNVVGSGDLE